MRRFMERSRGWRMHHVVRCFGMDCAQMDAGNARIRGSCLGRFAISCPSMTASHESFRITGVFSIQSWAYLQSKGEISHTPHEPATKLVSRRTGRNHLMKYAGLVPS
jgi:hypothetical protein